MKFAIYTLGCKVNQYDSQRIREILINNNYVESSFVDSDIIIINSCTVTATGDQKSRQAVRRFKKNNPNALTILTGCYPQALFEKDLPVNSDADIVIGNACLESLPDRIENYFNYHKVGNFLVKHTLTDSLGILKNGIYEGKTRASVKIEDGCNRFCKYCMVPYARGRVRSKPLEDIKYEVELLSNNGCKEIVLCGINITNYGSDLNNKFDIGDVVTTIDSISGIERIRIGSMEPDQINDSIIKKFTKSKKLCPQFHLSLQSGSDTVLERMGRYYNTKDYSLVINKLRDVFPDCSITTDIMVGYPGETETEHNESLEFAKKIEFAKMHVFSYSRRTGTPAANMPNQIPNSVKSKRSSEMIAVSDNLTQSFIKKMINTTQEVLFEQKVENNTYEGYTKNYITVLVNSDIDIIGTIQKVKITQDLPLKLQGDLING